MSQDVILLHEHELGRWGPVQRGDKLRAYCPVHGGDHQRSMEIRLEDEGAFKKGYGHCFNCKATVFVVELDPERAERIARYQQGDGRPTLRNVDLLKPRKRAACTPEAWQQAERSLLTELYPRMRTALASSKRAQTYLEERAIPLELAQAAGVVYLPPAALNRPDLQDRRSLLEKWIDALIFPLWAESGQRGYAARTLRLWEPGMDENTHKELLEAYAKQAGNDQNQIRRWRKTNPAGYFGVAPGSLDPCVIIVEGPFDRLALLAAGLKPVEVLALVGTALQVETLPSSVQSIVLALDGDESGQQANQKLAGEVQTAGLGATLCPIPADGQGKDWSERWRRNPDPGEDAIYPIFEAWSAGHRYV